MALVVRSKAGLVKAKQDNCTRVGEAEFYEQELVIMAEAAAYFHVAYKVSPLLSTVGLAADFLPDSALSTTSLALFSTTSLVILDVTLKDRS